MVALINAAELGVFVTLFAAITAVGMLASRWRRGDLEQLDEWGLAGRRFGGFVTWFLQGGSIYTTYSFIAVPALVFGQGVIGFYALPYLVLAYFVMYLMFPRLWSEAKARNYVTASDFVKDRFNSSPLAVVIALTGIVAMVPYVALQVYGIEICLSEIGLPVEVSLIVATTVLALITYVSGLRAAALISIAKDVLIWTTVLVAVIYLPVRLGGFGRIFDVTPPSKITLPRGQYAAFSTLAVGSALALYLYPHTFTGSLSASSPRVTRLNASTLPVYTIMLGLLALLGYVGIAAQVAPSPHYGDNIVVPALIQTYFPPWFAGFGLAAIAIGALVPASVMSIAAGSLFGRNVYGEIASRSRARRDQRRGVAVPATSAQEVAWGGDALTTKETRYSKYASFAIKFLAVGFILLVPATFVINFQLAGGVWILQSLPAVFLSGLLPWLDWRAVLTGWAIGMGWGTYLLAASRFSTSTTTLSAIGWHAGLYIGIPTVTANLATALMSSGVLIVVRRRHLRLYVSHEQDHGNRPPEGMLAMPAPIEPPPAGTSVTRGRGRFPRRRHRLGTPALFLHGGGHGCTAWSDFGPVAPLFAADRRCLLADLLQCGKPGKGVITGPMRDFRAAGATAPMDVPGIARADRNRLEPCP